MAAILAIAFFVSLACSAQSLPDAPSSRLQGFLSGGAVYDVRERDPGAFVEIGVAYRDRLSVSAVAFQDITDPWGYRALQPMGRVWILPELGVEAGYEFGYGCMVPAPQSCDRWLAPWRTPIAGVAYRRRVSRHVSAIARLDVTQIQLSSPVKGLSGGKDGGLRFNLGALLK